MRRWRLRRGRGTCGSFATRSATRPCWPRAEGGEITDDDLPPLDTAELSAPQSPEVEELMAEALAAPWGEARRLFEKVYISHALRLARGNRSEAARMTGMSRSALRELLKRTEG